VRVVCSHWGNAVGLKNGPFTGSNLSSFPSFPSRWLVAASTKHEAHVPANVAYIYKTCGHLTPTPKKKNAPRPRFPLSEKTIKQPRCEVRKSCSILSSPSQLPPVWPPAQRPVSSDSFSGPVFLQRPTEERGYPRNQRSQRLDLPSPRREGKAIAAYL